MMFRPAMLLPAAVCVLLTFRIGQACYPTAVQTGLLGADKGTTPVADKYTDVEVQAHAEYLVQLAETDYRQDGNTTLGCVDARADFGIHGTPGGDLAEFAGALSSYYKLIGTTSPTYADIKAKFKAFKDKYITPKRPFYYHSDDTRLQMVFQNLSGLFGRRVNVLPSLTPTNATEKDLWLQELSDSYAQGCGHLRLMIANPGVYGLSSNFVIKSVIKVYVEEWWAAANTAEKDNFAFAIKLGPLIGKAIAVVSNAGGTCQGYSPAVIPNYFGSSVFTYTPASATAFRKNVLVPFFGEQSNSLNKDAFLTEVNRLHNEQLNATLTFLSPANAINLYTVAFTTAGTVPTTTEPTNTPAPTKAAFFAGPIAGVWMLLITLGLIFAC